MPTEQHQDEIRKGGKSKRISMSNHQYGQLRYIAFTHKNGELGIDEVAWLSQVTLGSLRKRKYISETKDRDGIQITKEGLAAIRGMETDQDFFRQQSRLEFSSLLSLEVLQPQGNRAEVVPHRKTGA